jgi:diacylglycerol kinase family enzyme
MRVRSARPALRVGIDGELFTLQTPLNIEIAPQSVRVKVPRS